MNNITCELTLFHVDSQIMWMQEKCICSSRKVCSTFYCEHINLSLTQSQHLLQSLTNWKLKKTKWLACVECSTGNHLRRSYINRVPLASTQRTLSTSKLVFPREEIKNVNLFGPFVYYFRRAFKLKNIWRWNFEIWPRLLKYGADGI